MIKIRVDKQDDRKNICAIMVMNGYKVSTSFTSTKGYGATNQHYVILEEMEEENVDH